MLAHAVSMYTFYYQRSTKIEINIGRQQKQVTDVYVQLLKAPRRIEAYLKGSLKDRILWTYFRNFTVYTKI